MSSLWRRPSQALEEITSEGAQRQKKNHKGWGFVFKSSGHLETSEERSAERRGGYYKIGKAVSLQLNCKQRSTTRKIICLRSVESWQAHVRKGLKFSHHHLSDPEQAVANEVSTRANTRACLRTPSSCIEPLDTEWGQMKLNNLNWIFQVLLNSIFSSAGIPNPLFLSTDALLGVRFPHPLSLPWDLTSLLWAWISSFNSVSASSTELNWAQKNPITVVREGE